VPRGAQMVQGAKKIPERARAPYFPMPESQSICHQKQKIDNRR